MKAPSKEALLAIGLGAIVIGSMSIDPEADAATGDKPAKSTSLSKHLQDIRFCESSDRYTIVNPQGVKAAWGIEHAEGAFQFLPSTWAEYKTGYAHPADAPASVQDEVATKHQAKYGDTPWLESKPCWSKR